MMMMSGIWGVRERRIKHYSSGQAILLVGDGDFSFSVCLAMAFGSAANIVATSLDTYDELINKYKNARRNVDVLNFKRATLLYGVDATRMVSHPVLQTKKFHRIIYNFPHAGFYGKEDIPDLITMNQDLVRGFLSNASSMLWIDGEVHINHKTTAPFDRWRIEELGLEYSLICVRQDEFKIEDYPGYCNKRGSGPRPDEPFPLGACRTFKFKLICGVGLEYRMKKRKLDMMLSSPQMFPTPLEYCSFNPPRVLHTYRNDHPRSSTREGYQSVQKSRLTRDRCINGLGILRSDRLKFLEF